jgi:hypothetical protein
MSHQPGRQNSTPKLTRFTIRREALTVKENTASKMLNKQR